MKKYIKMGFTITLIIMVIVGVICGIEVNEWKVNSNKKLYEASINYLVMHDDNPDRNLNGYHMFKDYKGFGTSIDDKYIYAYIWILDEEYYVKNNKIYNIGGANMPYKFTIKKDSLDIIKVETPEDSPEYESSIRKLFPPIVSNKMLKYDGVSNKNILEDVKKYYSYLNDTTIYYE